MIGAGDEALRLVAAAVLGAAIGFERERGARAAGLRTHALVALGAALVMIVSAFGFTDAVIRGQAIGLDPSRMAAQVVSGIGFLGAGAIILRRGSVQGLTTAGSLWLVAGIGLACGGGMYTAAVITTVLALVILRGLKEVERRIFAHRRIARMTLKARREPGQLDAIEEAVRAHGWTVRRAAIDAAPGAREHTIRMEVRGVPRESIPALAEQLRSVSGIRMVAYGRQRVVAENDDEDEDE